MIAGLLSQSLFQQAVRHGATRHSVIRASRGWDEDVIELFPVMAEEFYDNRGRPRTCRIKRASVRPPPTPRCRPPLRRRRTP